MKIPKPGARPFGAIMLVPLLLTPSAPAAGQTLGRDVVVERDVMIPTADGERLATDIYRPAVDGVPQEDPLPLLLQRTPYGKGSARFEEPAIHFASRGYVVAIQDIRGRYGSSGTFSKYHPHDAPDGRDAVEWLARLQYVDGRVGMWGTSYAAHTQADAAKMDPEGLAALILNQGGMANAWDHAVRQGGAFELGRELTWAFRQIPLESEDPVVRALFQRERVQDWYSALPLREGLSPLSVAPEFESYLLAEWRHGDYDDVWRAIGINWEEYYDQTADVPMVHVGGWYDIFLRGTIGNFTALRERGRAPQWLIIGPWTHSGNARTYAGDVDFGPDAAIRDFTLDFQLRWFDHLLKGRATGVEDQQPVRIFVMGDGDGTRDEHGRLRHGGRWVESASWPLEGTRSLTLHLHQGGTLSEAPSAAPQASTTYTFDPSHPVPTVGGNVSARLSDGAYDQRERPDFPGSRAPWLPLRARPDVLVFQTEPLEEDVTVVGPITIHLFTSSSAVDTDFTVKLLDVYPPSTDFPSGFDLNLTDAIVRASYRNGRHTRDLIEPGQVYELVIEPFPTANVFKRGHRIRIDVSSSNFPRWDVNPNTGEPLGRHRRVEPAQNTVHHDVRHPSRVVLSVVP